jgi:hypothetical protein
MTQWIKIGNMEIKTECLQFEEHLIKIISNNKLKESKEE